MIKAVFMDYTGTMVQEEGKEIQEVVMRICKNSDLHDPQEAVSYWWKQVKEYEESRYGDCYLTEEEIVDEVLTKLEDEFHLEDDLEELHELFREFWVHAPLFPDVKGFHERCGLPIYVITNNGVQYVKKSMQEKGLHPAGIISADMVRAYKPHKEIFDKALEISGCKPEEVVHIGDSYMSDVQGALEAGIQPILVSREKTREYPGVTVVRSLDEVAEIR
ncbi:HAD family hydrolase [Faecalicatena sp. AGMB00832]|uniref:HAD family hydrolase n=1 Tax=Faecalicatena faecalis TaxID=2726362 RepID=A0ABS6D131_9FIRM|nr:MULTISPECIES: HAD family hydrolase [Faecalicatena]MBU3875299.1 HAD family hydrolase [Faecalicatena faecalis]MCI6467935.1 HAD family hydrolase [Faecalicatena sp.]MDY5619423.1 HAD family hydrolase [Lachnospiraceae bacterium]